MRYRNEELLRLKTALCNRQNERDGSDCLPVRRLTGRGTDALIALEDDI